MSSKPKPTCSVEGCERTVVARGLCGKHYQVWRKTVEVLPPRASRKSNVKRVCQIEGCENPARAHGWCGKHYWRYRQHGDPLGTAPKRPNYNALGFDPRHAEVDYSTIHEWVRSHFPKTGCCEHCGVTDRRTQYAAVRPGFFPRDRTGWLELCVPCHRKYDGRTGTKYTPEQRAARQIRQARSRKAKRDQKT